MAQRGKPSTITPAALKKLENAFRVGATITEALGIAEVSQDAFDRYCKKHPDYRGKIKQWRGQITLSAKTIIARAIRNDNVQMAMKLLELEEKKEARREYARRWRTEQGPEKQNGTDKTPSGFMTQFLTELNGEDSGDEQQNT